MRRAALIAAVVVAAPGCGGADLPDAKAVRHAFADHELTLRRNRMYEQQVRLYARAAQGRLERMLESKPPLPKAIFEGGADWPNGDGELVAVFDTTPTHDEVAGGKKALEQMERGRLRIIEHGNVIVVYAKAIRPERLRRIRAALRALI